MSQDPRAFRREGRRQVGDNPYRPAQQADYGTGSVLLQSSAQAGLILVQARREDEENGEGEENDSDDDH
ncbi:hypothetical protein LTS10_013343 [Elasticomyces elasticus]|nr:hypothetical protein LTS10_013343 [Elasticomyces elasticus]